MSELRMFVAVGECEAHWVIATDQQHANTLLTDWLRDVSGAWEEYATLFEEEGPDPWSWRTLGPDEILTEDNEGEEPDVVMPVHEWIEKNGAGHLRWGEVG